MFVFLLLTSQTQAIGPIFPLRPRLTKKEREKKIDLFIGLDNSNEAKFLKNELTRNWLNTPFRNKDNEPTLLHYNAVSAEIKRRANLHYITDVTLPGPAIKYSRRSEWIVLDKRAFSNTTFPLLTVKYYLDLKQIDLINEQYDEEQTAVMEKYTGDLFQFAKDTNLRLRKVYKFEQYLWIKGITAIYCFKDNRWHCVYSGEPIDARTSKVYMKDKSLEYHVVYGKVVRLIGFGSYENSDELKVPDINIPPAPFPKVYRQPLPPWEPQYNYFPSDCIEE